MSDRLQRYRVLSAGILNLILVMGIARFAYTPLLPIMQQQAGLGAAEGGWLAAVNYLGYLCGAVVASLCSDLVLKDRLYRIGLVLAVLSTAGMGLTENFWLWSLLRFLAGLSCASGMLLGSGLILNWLIRHQHRSELGIHFSGVGLGMLVCALAVEWMSPRLTWDQQWLVLTLLGVLIMVPAWIWLPRPEASPALSPGAAMEDNPPGRLFLRLLILAYFCAGVGYVVSATFIVAIIDQIPGLQGRGGWTFMVMGLAAVPSAILWDLAARRIGTLNALISACLLQTLGILLPVVAPGLMMSMAGAVLFGGTFVGIVCLVLTMAGLYYPGRPARMMGKMTLAFGVAQMIAPAVTGILAEHSGNYGDGLYLAAGVMGLGTLILLLLKGVERREQRVPAAAN